MRLKSVVTRVCVTALVAGLGISTSTGETAEPAQAPVGQSSGGGAAGSSGTGDVVAQPTTQPSRLLPPDRPERSGAGPGAGSAPAASGVSGADSSQTSDRLRPPPVPNRPATQQSPADQLLNQMLRPKEAARRPLLPSATGALKDVTSGPGATAPEAPLMPLLQEGTFIVDRTGRLTRSKEGTGLWELTFDADGRALRDPPLLLLPNSRLEAMEVAMTNQSSDLRFRVTGVVTTYRGRNGLLVEKAAVIPAITDLNTQ